MISNIRGYYKQCFSNVTNFYVEIRNKSSFYLNTILHYTLNGKRISKPNPVFGPGKIQHVVFPGDATILTFDLFNCYYNPPRLILNQSFPDHVSSCFNVTQTQYSYIVCKPTQC